MDPNEKNLYRCKLQYNTIEEKRKYKRLVAMVRDVGIDTLFDKLDDNKPTDIEEIAEQIKVALKPFLDQYSKDLSVSSFRAGAWQQKQAGEFLVSIKAVFQRDHMVAMQRLVERIESGWDKIRPHKEHKPHPTPSDYVSMVNMFDMHLDKSTLYQETGRETDIFKNIDLAHKSFESLLVNIGNPELIVFPVGNDLFNVNDIRNSTYKGTPQPTYLHHVDAYSIIYDFIEQCIKRLVDIAPVKVISVPGNHDQDLSNILNISLSKQFRGNPSIEFMASRISRKHVTYGRNLFVFEHGDKVRPKSYTGQVAVEFPQEFADAQYRYGIFGHQHRETTIEEQGFKMMFLRGVSDTCVWHYDNGYFGIPKSVYEMRFSKCGRSTTVNTVNF